MNKTIEVASVVILVPKTASGFFTGVSLKSYLASLGLKNVNVIDVQSCHIKQVKIPKTVQAIYIGGLGLKNCPQEDLYAFIDKYHHAIAFWADNHPVRGEIKAMTAKDKRHLYYDALDDKAPSCTALLNKLWGNNIIKPEWVAAANHLENQTKYPASDLANEYKKIINNAKKNDEICQTNHHVNEAKSSFAKRLVFGEAN